MKRTRCPYDPGLQADITLDLHDCPVCGCSVFSGLPHGECTDRGCLYYDRRGWPMPHPSRAQAVGL